MRKEKELLKTDVQKKISKYDSFVIMKYAKLSANAANEFRKEIGKAGGEVEVVRKRILLKAAKEANVDLDIKTLEGHVGLIFLGSDPIETTKTVMKFSQERENAIKILLGRYEGKLYQGVDVERLSKLPSKNEMRAQFLSTLEAPMSQTLAVMEAVLSSVVYCLDNKTKQESGS